MSNPTSKSPGILGNAAWNAFSTVSSIIVTFLLAPVLIKTLGIEQWGLLLLVWSITGVLGIANFGVGEATLRFLARYHADSDLEGVNRVIGATLTFYLGVCGTILVVLLAGAQFFVSWVKVPPGTDYPVDWLLRLSGFLFSLGMVSNAFRCVQMALQRYDISSKLAFLQSITRSVGFIVLALTGFGVLSILAWDLAIVITVLVTNMVIARRLVPNLRLTPSMSLDGIREIFGYSVYTFATHLFLMAYREGGKLILGSRGGPASVAYLGTPDSISHRLHTIVVSAVETLMPRFSATRDAAAAQSLLTTATWAASTCSVALFIPLAVLMPDFLRLWINPAFAREAGLVGQFLALSFLGCTSFAPIATLYRGIGKPGYVTVVMAFAGSIIIITTLALASSLGALSVSIGYLLTAVAYLGGIAWGWFRLGDGHSVASLMRSLALPLVIGLALGAGEYTVRGRLGELGWIGMLAAGGAFFAVNAAAVFGLDQLLGGNPPSRPVTERLLRSRPFSALQRRLNLLPSTN